jgi:hypothetical protein
MNYPLIDRRQFLNIRFKEYEENSSEIENVQHFEHFYSSLKALKYFINQTFLYHLLIKSLQLFNIDMLFLLRFNSFIIAKKNREQILKSLQNCPNKNHFNSVLFHIEINSIGKQLEDVILFSITRQFRILSID